MSAYADDPEHFWRWLQRQGLAPEQEPAKIYVPRHVYADYLAERPRRTAAGRGRERPAAHRLGGMRLGRHHGAGVEVRLANGTSLVGHVAVLAVGHEEHPIAGKDIAMRPGSEADTPIDPDATVLILGTGLSMVDAWLSLAARGHRGRTVALSRRGLMSSLHRKGKPIRLDSADVPLGTDLSYFVRWFRDLVRETERAGGDWRDVVDGIRPFNQRIWQSWPPSARRRFIEHTRAWWDVHRHRMPPALHERVCARRRRTARCSSLPASWSAHVRDGDGFAATIRRRGATATETLNVARIYDCTGIISDLATGSNPIVRSLIDRGLARPDPLRIGLDVTEDCAIIKADGQPSRAALCHRTADARHLLRDRRHPRHPHPMRDAGQAPDRPRRAGRSGRIATPIRRRRGPAQIALPAGTSVVPRSIRRAAITTSSLPGPLPAPATARMERASSTMRAPSCTNVVRS